MNVHFGVRKRIPYLGLAGVLLLMAVSAFAQAITGTLVGTLHDSSGGVIVGAGITVTNRDTGRAVSQTSDDQGNYVVTNLPPGNYNIRVEYPGFRTATAADNVVQVQQTLRVDFELMPGAVTEILDVVSAAPLVRSTTSEIGHVIESEQIQVLPLNGRLFQQLITLTPGAVQRGFADFGENPAAAGARSAIHASVNGLPWSGNNFLLDGVANNEPLNAFINVTPPLEAIDQFKVQTNNPTAEFGVFGGAVVNLTMRSGTNALHGALFEYLRNDKLNSRDFFASTRAPFKTNQFGGAIGGPIIRNRAFFFGDYQGLRQRQGRTFLITVPTPLMRQGVLTEGSDAPVLYDPLTRQPFSNRTIPVSRMDPVSRLAADVWPAPNLAGLTSNYLENTSLKGRTDAYDVKVDVEVTQSARFFARHSLSERSITDPPPGNVFMNNSFGINADSRNQNAAAGLTYSFSPNTINEARFGFNRYAVTHFGSDFGIAKNNELGIPNGNVASQPYTFGIARFDIPGIHPTGSLGSTNAVRIANTFQYTDNLTWIRGRHVLKFGGDIRRIQSTLTNPQTQPRGQFQFDRNLSSNLGAAGTGSPWASFLLGYPWRVDRDFVDTRPGVRMTYAGFYLQDDLRLTPALTLNLGMRWDVFTRPVEKYNRQSNFNPGDGLIHVASADNPAPDVDNYLRNWGPRVGIAYSPDRGRTAFRAAYGISYFPDNFGATGGTLERNYPFFLLNVLQGSNQFTPFRRISDGLPGFTPVALQPTLPPPPGFAVFFIPRDFRQDMAQMWNFSVQRQLGWKAMVEAAYVGTRGTRIYRNRNINVPLPGAGPIAQRRPFYSLVPNVTDVNQRAGDGDSYYNSAQFKLEKRFSDGFQTLVSYTISKSIDTVSSPIYPYLDSLNRGLSSGFKAVDIPQNLVVSYRYELPFGDGRAYFNGSGAAGKLAGGWALNGITTIQSGQPLFVNVSSSRLNTGTGNRADITCAEVNRPKLVEQWFDTGCFADPAPFVFGNSGIGHVRGPGLVNFDFSVFKNTAIDEARAIEFRAEFFNLFNNPHFGNPNTTFGTTSFGRISATTLTPREVQLGLRFVF